MTRVLVTAFEPYGEWTTNSSLMCLRALEQDHDPACQLALQVYPVDFQLTAERIRADLLDGYDFALHLGQAPGSTEVRLEAIGLNIGQEPGTSLSQFSLLDGPLALACELPLVNWAERILQAGVPCRISYHAGTYLCNALLYWSLHATRSLPTQSTFVHLPLDPSQCAAGQPCLPWQESLRAIHCILSELPRMNGQRQGR